MELPVSLTLAWFLVGIAFYAIEFGNLTRKNNTAIVPGSLTDISTMVSAAIKTLDHAKATPAGMNHKGLSLNSLFEK